MYLFVLHHLKSIVNVKAEASEETEEEKEQKHKTFVEKYEKQIKHFGKVVLLFYFDIQTMVVTKGYISDQSLFAALFFF